MTDDISIIPVCRFWGDSLTASHLLAFSSPTTEAVSPSEMMENKKKEVHTFKMKVSMQDLVLLKLKH